MQRTDIEIDSDSTQPPTPYFDSLPDEVVLDIFSAVVGFSTKKRSEVTKNLASISRVSKRFHAIASEVINQITYVTHPIKWASFEFTLSSYRHVIRSIAELTAKDPKKITVSLTLKQAIKKNKALYKRRAPSDPRADGEILVYKGPKLFGYITKDDKLVEYDDPVTKALNEFAKFGTYPGAEVGKASSTTRPLTVTTEQLKNYGIWDAKNYISNLNFKLITDEEKLEFEKSVGNELHGRFKFLREDKSKDAVFVDYGNVKRALKDIKSIGLMDLAKLSEFVKNKIPDSSYTVPEASSSKRDLDTIRKKVALQFVKYALKDRLNSPEEFLHFKKCLKEEKKVFQFMRIHTGKIATFFEYGVTSDWKKSMALLEKQSKEIKDGKQEVEVNDESSKLSK